MAVTIVALLPATASAAKPRRIVYMGVNANGQSPGIYSIRPDGKQRRRILRAHDDDLDPSWSPHQNNVVFARGYALDSGPRQSKRKGLYRVRADGSGLREILAAQPGKEYVSQPAWSPGGRRIAFAFHRPAGSAIFTISARGKHLKRLTPYGAVAWHPSWSPDGRRLVYRAPAGITTMRADGTDRHVISADGQEPDWSPDGKLIAFTASRDDLTVDVITVRPDGSHERRITASRPQFTCPGENECGRKDRSPAWGPGGRHLVFAEEYDLFVTRRDGSHTHRLVKFGSFPEW